MSKFANDYDERVYNLTLDGGYDSDGDVEAPTGWFASVTLDDDSAENRDMIEHYGHPYLLVSEDSQGFVTVHAWHTAANLADVFQLQAQQYALWDAGVTVDQYVAVYSGYRASALWTSCMVNEDGTEGVHFDEIDAGFTVQAQASMREDVTAFVTGCAEEIRQFLDITGLDWGQVGHDFWLTRNRHGAGFWDRGAAGPAVDTLVEESHGFGESTLYLNDDGEIEVS